VPYDSWTRSLFGFSLDAKLGWTRNNFDRLVHITYGLCLGPILFWQFADRLGWRARWAAFGAVNLVLSTSALYELFEWVIGATLAPATAEAYNGQQGDIWDPHKDMTCALIASIVAVLLVIGWRRIKPVSPPPAATTT
jgi:putative membrane protein